MQITALLPTIGLVRKDKAREPKLAGCPSGSYARSFCG